MDRQISIHRPSPSDVDIKEVGPILEGKLMKLPPINSRLVKVFVSSTFADFVHERNVLMEKAYPKLKEYCRENYGLEFQMVDLRWGIQEESADDHTIIDFCVQEIENCRKASIGPSFVLFFGQKYGFRPLPPHIPAHEFELLTSVLIENRRDVTVLRRWYHQDTNVVPPIYSLQPISSILKNYNNKKDQQLMDSDRQQWSTLVAQIKWLLRHGAQICTRSGKMTEKEKEKYFVSVTEYEIQKGLLELEDADRHCLVFTRDIKNLKMFSANPRAQKYLDFIPGHTELDREANYLLKTLKTQKIPQVIRDANNSAVFELQWSHPDRTDPNKNDEYLQTFYTTFIHRMKRLVTRSVNYIQNLATDSYVMEVLQHLSMCERRCKVFRGREEEIGFIQRYLFSEISQPLVVYGVSGSGKTSVLAKAASLVHGWYPHGNPVLVLRFLGTTARSSSIRLVLGSVCWQIASLYGQNTEKIPGDYPGLVSYFHEALECATMARPLLIFFDSLDQLSETHRAHNLIWLPRILPKHVHFVVSTLPQEFQILETLRECILEPENYLEVLPLGQNLGVELIREWLRDAQRNLTPNQSAIVNQALSHCSLPLYAKLIFEDICKWRSYTPPDQTRLANTVKGVINMMFERVEKYYGKVFVTHALSYLTASKNGLSDVEIEDLLSLDDLVLNDVFTYWLPPIRRLPPLLIPRLHNELNRYIIQREANGMIVYYWYHRQFITVAQERYLSTVAHRLYIHSSLAHYFMGTWGGGRKKPFRYSSIQVQSQNIKEIASQADRKVPLQPLILGTDAKKPFKVRYNLRKLSELPFHLNESRRYADLKEEVLFNYEWLHTKLTAMSLHDLMSDFRLVATPGNNDTEVQLLHTALRMGGSYVNQNPDTLAFDLCGRLLPCYSSHKNIRSLLYQCDTISLKHSALLPVFQCYEAPRGMLLYILEDHTKVVYDLIFSKATNELISVSRDQTIAFWDLFSGEQSRTIDISSASPGPHAKLLQSDDGKYLIYDSGETGSAVHVYNLKSSQLLHKMGNRSNLQRRVFMAGSLLCRQKSIFDVRTGELVACLDDYVQSRKYVSCSITPDERHILIGGDTHTSMFHLGARVEVARFPGTTPPFVFVPTPDSRKAYVGYTETCLFKVFDIDNDSETFGEVTHSFDCKSAFPAAKMLETSPLSNELAEIAISPQDKNVVLLNIKRCQLILYKIETQDAKLIDVKALKPSKKLNLTGSCFSKNRQYILAAQDHCFHIWSSESGRLMTTVTLHSVYRFPMTVSKQYNLVATGSTIHTAIKVWDLDKIQQSEVKQLVIYENPVDTLASAPDNRLMFVKKYHGLMSHKGYKYIDSFGLDVWNLSTGNCITFLPFAQYGRLIQLEASSDGRYMGMLLSNRNESFVCLIDMRVNKVISWLPHWGCKCFVTSSNWAYIATYAEVDGEKSVKLWNAFSANQLECFDASYAPVITYDDAYLLFIREDYGVAIFSLTSPPGLEYLSCAADKLQVVPCHHNLLVTTRFPRDVNVVFAEVQLWDFRRNQLIKSLSGIGSTGICCISKNGTLAIDSFLQLFNIRTGMYVRGLPHMGFSIPTFVQLTHDAKYAIWIDDLTVKVCRTSDGRLVANMSTHEKPISVQAFDFGYILAIGREDGHVLTVKLMEDNNLPSTLRTFEERTTAILAQPVCTNDVIAKMDYLFRKKPQEIPDSALPQLSESVQVSLQQRAKVLHVIMKNLSIPKSCSLSNLVEAAKDTLDKKRSKDTLDGRRGSSPIAHLFEGRRSKEGSPVTKKKLSPKPPKKKNGRALKEKSKSLHDLLSTSRVVANAGTMLFAVSEMGTQWKWRAESKKKRLSLPKLETVNKDDFKPRDRTPSF